MSKHYNKAMFNNPSRMKSLIFANIGTIIEWYDFCLYNIFSNYLYQIFFPHDTAAHAQMLIFLIYTLGYLSRAIGGCFLSTLADRKGRKSTFIISSTLMTSSTIMMAAFPVHHLGSHAIFIFFVLIRIIQGTALGIEYPGGLVYIYEHADPKKRLPTMLFNSFASNTGSILGVIVCYCLIHHYHHQAIMTYAWRIPYIIAAIAGLFLIAIRHTASETPDFLNLKPSVSPKLFTPIIKNHSRLLLTMLLAYVLCGCVQQFIDMSNIYFIHFFHYHIKDIYTASGAKIITIYITVSGTILFMKKKYTPYFLLGLWGVSICGGACSFWLLKNNSLFNLIFCTCLNAFSEPIIFIIIIFHLCNHFPTQIRTTAIALFNNTGTFICATFPFFIHLLVNKTGNPFMVPEVILGLSIIMLWAILKGFFFPHKEKKSPPEPLSLIKTAPYSQ